MPDQFLRRLDRLLQHRMVVAVAVGFQSHRAQQVAWLDSAPRAVGLLMLEEPFFGVSQRARAQRFYFMAIVKAQRLVGEVQRVAQRQQFFSARLFELREMRRLDVQLEHSALVVDLFFGPRRLQHHQSHQRSARPRAQLVDVEREPVREKRDLDRQRRRRIPGNLAHRRQVKARQRPAIHDAALRQNPAPRRRHRLVAGAHAGQLQRKITFDRRRQIAFAALVKRPTPVRTLRVEQILLQARLGLDVNRVHEMVEDDELRVHLRVRLERRVPVALGLLQREQRALRAIDGVVDLRDELVMRRHRNRGISNLNRLSHFFTLHGITAHFKTTPRSSISNTSAKSPSRFRALTIAPAFSARPASNS